MSRLSPLSPSPLPPSPLLRVLLRVLVRVLMPAVLLALLLPSAVHAQTRAWLDRERIGLGETATLNVETDQGNVTAPDWTPLDADFEVSGHTSTRQVETVDGQSRSRALFAVALRPRSEGLVTVPALRVGQERTRPLTLTVSPAATAPARAGAASFIEAEADAQEAYPQQAIGYVLRLYYATPLVSGQLEQPQPAGAALQRIGNDVQYSRDIAGRRYTVLERRFLLVPERSGALTIPGARFTGRGTGGFFDNVFGDGSRNLRADGPSVSVQVRPVPDGAPRPWLPLRGLEARFLETPQRGRAGEAVDVVVELRADGATAAQMPEPELQVGDGAQVFAEPPQTREHFDRGRPQAVLTRRFSIVPRRAGTLQVASPGIEWWDARAGAARTTVLPALAIQVEADPAAAASEPPVGEARDDDERWVRVPGVQGEVRPWAVATVAFALLWLATLGWALQRRPALAGGASRARQAPVLDAVAPARSRLRRLRLALDTGDLGEVAEALCALADPPAPDLDALRLRLQDPAQIAAVDGLQRARWAGGDPAAARAGVREAFGGGARWRDAPGRSRPPDPVPPLYPD